MSELGCVEGPEWTESANTEKSIRRSRKKGQQQEGTYGLGKTLFLNTGEDVACLHADVVDLVEWERSTWEGKGMKVKAKSLTG